MIKINFTKNSFKHLDTAIIISTPISPHHINDLHLVSQ